MLHGQMVLGNLSTVKDGSTNLKCPPRYFPWGGGLGKVEINAGAETELGKKSSPVENFSTLNYCTNTSVESQYFS